MNNHKNKSPERVYRSGESLADTEIDAISLAFVQARRAARPLSAFPGVLPHTLHDAYAIQDLSRERWRDQVAGWKIGLIPEPHRSRFKVDRLVGPIFENAVSRLPAGGSISMPAYAGGFAAVEAEFVLELARDVPAVGSEVSDQDLPALVRNMFIGVEIASSPLSVINALGPTSIVSDFGNNRGLVVGPAIADWQNMALEQLVATVSVESKPVGAASAAAVPGGPLAAMAFVLRHCASRGIHLPAGTLLSTGAVTGVHEAPVPSSSRVGFGVYGEMEILLEAAQPAAGY